MESGRTHDHAAVTRGLFSMPNYKHMEKEGAVKLHSGWMVAASAVVRIEDFVLKRPSGAKPAPFLEPFRHTEVMP
jgi:hypothetical protein